MMEKVDLSTVNFLVVDGNRLSAELVSDLLKTLGAVNVDIAEEYLSAISILRSGGIDVLITELHLKPKDGLELIRTVRRDLGPAARQMPIMALTAKSEAEQVKAARDAGVTEFLAKPYGVEAFYRRIVGLIARPRSFVDSEIYFGPDRRRRQVPFDGIDRRRESKGD